MLSVSFLGTTFRNPLVLASGILGVTGASMAKVIKDGAGGVTVKSLSLLPRTGHPNPTIIANKDYMLNAVGLSNPGVEEGVKELKHFKELSKAPLIGSIFAGTAKEFGQVGARIGEAPIDFLEVDISCPNVGGEFGDPFAYSAKAIEAITKQVKKHSRVPVIIKLSPNAWNIGELARAAEAAGADALTCVNTVSSLEIDIRVRTPILSNKVGGLSGRALLPIALYCVFQVSQAVKIPIIGTGGVTTGEDVLAMIMAGATLVGVGTAVYHRGLNVFKKIAAEMEAVMREEGIKNLKEIRGAAHI